MGDGQHVWAAAEWVMMLRNCLLYEETPTKRLIVGAGILPEWLEGDEPISIGPAPTSWGPVRISLGCSGDIVTVRWNGNWFERQPEIEVRLPGAEPVTIASDDRREIQIPLQRV